MVGKTFMKLGDYEVSVLIEGKEVEHYQIELDEEKKTASCWIASEVGKHFGFRVRKAHTAFDCSARITLDGYSCGGMILRKSNVGHSVQSDVIIGQSEARLFTFSALTVTDDELSAQDPELSKSLGEMKIVFNRITNPNQQNASNKQIPKLQAVHERAKKATPHRVQYGDKVAFNGTVLSCKHHEVHANFLIRYTSLDMLRAMGISARPEPTPPTHTSSSPERPSPVPVSASKRKADQIKAEDDSDEDLDLDEQEERQRETELRAELERLTQSRESRKAKKRVKTEDFAPVFTPGEVIDLT